MELKEYSRSRNVHLFHIRSRSILQLKFSIPKLPIRSPFQVLTHLITRQETRKGISRFSMVVVSQEYFLKISWISWRILPRTPHYFRIAGNSPFSLTLYLKFHTADTNLHNQKTVANLAADFFSHIPTFNVGHCNKGVVIITAYQRPSCSQTAAHLPRGIVGASILKDVQKLTGHGSEQPGAGGPAWAEGLDWMTSSSLFQSQPFCDIGLVKQGAEDTAWWKTTNSTAQLFASVIIV